MDQNAKKELTILIPMAGGGAPFRDAGYAFPKPLVEIHGKTMVELVIQNLMPKEPCRFVFVCLREHYEKYDLYNILKNATGGNFEVVLVNGKTGGAACTALAAIEHINHEGELVIANGDQVVDGGIDDFLHEARMEERDGSIVVFESTHPKWSYVRVNSQGLVIETAEKKVISNLATAGIYYFQKGKDFVGAAQNMIAKNIRHNNEFYLCPSYNELLIQAKKVSVYTISREKMHGLGTPEEVQTYVRSAHV